MDHNEFRVKGKEMVDYIADYLEGVRDRRVYPDVQPGYLHRRLPASAPGEPESWDDIFRDVERHIMPGIVHWQSPHMHAYFPALTSYPSILGDMLSSAMNVLCFTWASSPAGTELETIAMNWLGKLLALPDVFLNEKDNSTGGGVIQTTASEATLVSLLAARTKALAELTKLNPEVEAAELLGHLICYCSDQAHSSVEKAGLIGLVRMRYVESDGNQSMRGAKLEEAILSDKANGLVPFWVCATLGTTGSVAFDNLREVGAVCAAHSAWLHVDAAYAGSAFICPEYRHWLDGVELANSFAFNPSKWLMVNFDCTAMWVRDSTTLHRTFNVNPIYLRHENSGKAIDYMVGNEKVASTMRKIRTSSNNIENAVGIENTFKTIEIKITENVHSDEEENVTTMNGYAKAEAIENKPYNEGYKDEIRGALNGYQAEIQGCGDVGEKIELEDSNKNEPLHWQIPLSRRFRALKLWFVLRNYGVSGLQKHIRESVRLAQKFEALVLADPRFEIPQPRNLGMVAFRLRGDNALTECLLKRLNGRGYIHAVPACFKGTYVIRFTVTSQRTTNQDILDDWAEIKTVASEILLEVFGAEDGNVVVQKKPRVSLKETRELNPTFGTSLLLANSPMSPKVMNGTYAAICDYEQVLSSCAQTFAQLNMEPKDNQEMRRRIRGIKMVGKKFSLDSCMDMVQGLMAERSQVPSLPLMTEDEREDANSNCSTPGDRSLTASPIKTAKPEQPPANHLFVPHQPRQYRSKSIDVTLPGLKDARFTIDMAKNEIVITPTEFPGYADRSTTTANCQNGDKTVKQEQPASDDDSNATNVELSSNDSFVEEPRASQSRLTITGPGSYIKKLIQQFSEGSFENEGHNSERDTQSIMDKADAICKKCLHYKGKVRK